MIDARDDSTECLFIGGFSDGDRILVDDKCLLYKIPSKTFEDDVYRRFRFLEKELFVHSSIYDEASNKKDRISNVLDLLIDQYQDSGWTW